MKWIASVGATSLALRFFALIFYDNTISGSLRRKVETRWLPRRAPSTLKRSDRRSNVAIPGPSLDLGVAYATWFFYATAKPQWVFLITPPGRYSSHRGGIPCRSPGDQVPFSRLSPRRFSSLQILCCAFDMPRATTNCPQWRNVAQRFESPYAGPPSRFLNPLERSPSRYYESVGPSRDLGPHWRDVGAPR